MVDDLSQAGNVPVVASDSGGRYRILALYFVIVYRLRAVLILEILGTRLLSPYFGNNAYVWSALISVTLLALALGYWIGGRWADSRGSPVLLDRVIAASALGVAAVPLLVRSLAYPLADFSFQAGILLSALVCFGPALFLLGMVTPIAVRIAAPDFAHVGRSVGAVYAWSTVGSILAALAAGFLLLPRMPVTRICYATGIVLLALAAARWLARLRPALLGAALFLVLAAAAGTSSFAFHDARPWRAGAFHVVLSRPSFYGGLRVVETKALRILLVDATSQAAQTRAGRQWVFPYTASFALMPYFRPSGKDLLLIGLGGGDMVLLLRQFSLRTTAVEIDSLIAEVAFQHFGIQRDEIKLISDDGRNYIRRRPGPFDFVIVDAFAGGSPPSHLFSREAFTQMKACLRSGGLLGINIVAGDRRDPILGDLASTLRSTFPHLLVLPMETDGDKLGNFIFFASDEPIAFPEHWDPPLRDSRLQALFERLRAGAIDPAHLSGNIITDELNTLDLRMVAVERKLRAHSRAILPRALLDP